MLKIQKKLLLFISFLFLSSCVHSYRSYKTPPTKSFVKIFRQVSVDKCKDDKCPEEKWVSSGSGTSIFIRKNINTILTAGHICQIQNLKLKDNIESLKTELLVLDHTQKWHKAEIIVSTLEDLESETKTADICILHVPTLNIPKASVSKFGPRIGERIISMSAPQGVYHPPTVPIFAGIYSGEVHEVSSLTTIPSLPGSSGASVLNSNMKIIGVIYAIAAKNPNISLMVSHQMTLDFIKKAKKILRKKNQSL